jgi:AcrR family transcriptional regulator
MREDLSRNLMAMPNTEERKQRDIWAEETRAALLDAARELFLEQGFQKARIEEIAERAGVTRGAFYHHFADKTAIFDAIVVALQSEVASFVESRARKAEDPWARLSAGIDAYLEAASAVEFQSIVIQEGPAVLGRARFREIDEAYVLRLVTTPLARLTEAGVLECSNVGMLSRMISAMVWEASTSLSGTKSPTKSRDEARAMVTRMLESFRVRPPARRAK